jgi:hypothetical protein
MPAWQAGGAACYLGWHVLLVYVTRPFAFSVQFINCICTVLRAYRLIRSCQALRSDDIVDAGSLPIGLYMCRHVYDKVLLDRSQEHVAVSSRVYSHVDSLID